MRISPYSGLVAALMIDLGSGNHRYPATSRWDQVHQTLPPRLSHRGTQPRAGEASQLLPATSSRWEVQPVPRVSDQARIRLGMRPCQNLQLTAVAGRRRLAADGSNGLGRGRNGAGKVVQSAAGAVAWPMCPPADGAYGQGVTVPPAWRIP